MKTHKTTMTDLYQLTMAAGYFSHDLNPVTTFELYVRRLPQNRSFLVAAGLAQAVDYLSDLSFEPEEIAYLKRLPAFKNMVPAFFEYLKDFQFTGDLWALPEGTLFFPYEPILRVTAPLIEAQIIETYLLSLINFQTSVASKAARIYQACQQKEGVSFVDFGSRRAHGPEAGVLAARAAFIGGAQATSNVYAGHTFGIPVVGTAAHAWTMAFPNEQAAFDAYGQTFPEHVTLLVDTYDTLEGTRRAISSAGHHLKGVRLDSGDFLCLSKEVRTLLDEAGLKKSKIIVSGDMNENKINSLLTQEAPIDVFGVGTELVTSIDAPSLGGVYKMVHQSGSSSPYKVKLSQSKRSYPGIKQVYRSAQEDIICLSSEQHPGEPLLKPVIQKGQLQAPLPSLKDSQNSFIKSLSAFHQKTLENPSVNLSQDLLTLFETTKSKVQKENLS